MPKIAKARAQRYIAVLIALAASAQLLAQTKGTNPVADPGFEAGSPNPFWNEASTNFGTPICTAGCGAVAQPFAGDWFAWFGGVNNGFEEGSISQDVTFGTGATDLTFWLRAAHCYAEGDDGHFIEILVDDLEVYRVDADSPICGEPYAQQRVDVSAWAGNSVHAVEFHSITDGGGTSNFFVDEVALEPRAPLAAYWPFEGDARDVSGRNRHGTLEGAATFVPGVSGQALDLAGDGWIDIAGPVLDGAEECTIAYWVRFESLTPADPSDPLSAIFAEDFFTNQTLHSNLAFWTDPDTLEWHIGGNPERATILAPTSAPTPWMHLTMAYSSLTGLSHIYLNGALAGTQLHAAPVACGSGAPSQIGSWDNGAGPTRFLDGQVDELRIYTKKLTAAEVWELAGVIFADGFESGDTSAW